MRVIETNLSMKDEVIKDHQSRIIEVNSWEDYCKAFSTYDGDYIDKFKALTPLMGCSIPKNAQIKNLKYDDFHLSCEVVLYNGLIDTKLAYLITN